MRHIGVFVIGLVLVATSLSAVPANAAGRPGRTSAVTAAAAPSASWPNAGHDLANSRNNPDEHVLGTNNVATLTKKWSADFTNNLTSTPAVSGGAVFLPDRAGKMWSFNALTGAMLWSHSVASYTGIAGDISRATPAVSAGRVIFGDQPLTGTHNGTHVVAVSTATGALLWNTLVDTQQTGKITGAPVVDGSTAYIGISSNDEGNATCCHFRGSVVALNVTTGKVLWRTYTAPVGYTGNAVWGGGPAIDHTTGLLYVGTGNNYSVPAGVCTSPAQTGCTAPAPTDYVDSLLALNLTTGKPVWSMRTLNSDVWTKVCTSPTTCGPDFDFGSAPNLFTATVGGTTRRLVGIGQKSGVYWAADAATGAIVWHTQVGPGGSTGGIQWGSAVDGTRIYVADTNSTAAAYTLQPSGAVTSGGAFSALDPATGHILWQTADPQGAGDFGFVSSANGVVYAGSGAGTGNTMYAMNAATGATLWSYASGGSVMGGAAIVNGTVYWASGYYTKTCPATQPGCGTTYRLYAFGLPATGALPTAATAVSAVATTSTSATMTWSPPLGSGTAVMGYRVGRDGKSSTGGGAYSTTVAATVQTFTMSKLITGSTYHLSVQAVDAAGNGSTVTIAVVMSATAVLAAPTAITVNQAAAGTATMAWLPPAAASGQTVTGYRVARDGNSTKGAGAYATTVAATARTFTMTNLIVGATYNLSVQAITATTTGPAGSGQLTVTN